MTTFTRSRRSARVGLAAAVAAVLAFGAAGAGGSGVPAAAQDAGDRVAEARRLNNVGVGYMNQQRFADALTQFEQAAARDPELIVARINKAIALIHTQRDDEARQVLEEITRREPNDVRVWYNLGLVYRNLGETEDSLDAFVRAAELDPPEPDIHYFVGLLASQLQRNEQAIAAFEEALRLSPHHASAEFGLARTHQRLGNAEQARTHLERFQRITAEKIGTPMGQAYGDQGIHSLAAAAAPETAVPPPTPVRFVPATGEAGLLPDTPDPPGDNAECGRQSFMAPAARPGKREDAGVGRAGRVGRVKTESSERNAECSASPDAVSAPGPPPQTDKQQSAPRQARGALSVSKGAIENLLGPGACFIDFDRDGHQDLLLLSSDPARPLALHRNRGDGRFAEHTEAAGLANIEGLALGCTAGDYDNDGWTDLAVSFAGRVALYRNQGDGTFRDVTEEAGIRTGGLPLGLTFVDYDHDGDLDLHVSRLATTASLPGPLAFPAGLEGPGNVLWRNNRDGTFTDVTEATGLAGVGPGVGAVATDINNDRAIDFVLTGRVPRLFLNPREGPFEQVDPWTPDMLPPAAGVVVFDFDKDGLMDVAFTHWEAPALTLWRNLDGRRFEPVELPPLDWTRGWGLTALDYDNDGWLDLAVVGERDGEGRAILLRNEGPRGFVDRSGDLGLDELRLSAPRAILAADYDADGDTDLIITQNDGPPVLLRNDGGNQRPWLTLRLEGLADNRNAVGTKVEVFAGALWQKWEVYAGSGYLGQNPFDIVAGLGEEAEAEIVRMLWPTGVLQDEVQLAARELHEVAEIDRRGSSCPILFAWNGERYEFVTDAIGPGILGHWVAPGQRNTPNPTEYIKVDGSRVQPRNGLLSFRFSEPMEEAIYLDQVRLLAIDYPADADVYPNEYFAVAPPFPEHRIIASRGARPPAGAWDSRGRDVLAELRHRDRVFVTGFDDLPFKGFAALHSLELDLGDIDVGGPVRLLMHGVTDYFTANSIFAAHQADIHPVVPYVEALAGTRWVRVGDIGFPAGLLRTMVADLTGRLPAGTERIRIWTNLKIYWDQILIDTTPEDEVPVRETEVPLVAATLAFRGFPREVPGDPEADLTYDYDEVSLTGPFARHAGAYTRFGDVLPLLTRVDDRFVVFGAGEEVELDFDPAGLPPLPPGWKRDYFFFAHGYAKDMDFYAAYGQTVEPLPYDSMPGYPYPSRRHWDDEYLEYLLELNDRHESGRGMPAYRFAFGPMRTSER